MRTEFHLVRWAVFELPDASRHLVGIELRLHDVRVSSTILRVDLHTKRFETAGGHVYWLLDEPGLTLNGEGAWRVWCEQNEVTDARNVSAELLVN